MTQNSKSRTDVEPRKRDELRRKILRIERLAAMPQVVFRLVEELTSQNANAGSLADIIESDPALASKVLSLANSAFFGFQEKITTIQRAVVAIGFQELQLLTLSTGLADVFKSSRDYPGFTTQDLWTHCLAVSWLARELAAASRHEAPSDLMIAGLLHDLGKLLMATHLQEEFEEICVQTASGKPYYLAEEAIGLRHAVLGRWLAEKWELPPLHTAVIGGHHGPFTEDEHYPAVCLTALADQMAKKLNMGLVNQSRPVDLGRFLTQWSIDLPMLYLIASKAETEFPKVVAAWDQMQS